MKFDIKKTVVIKSLTYLLLLCVLAVLQTTLFARFGLFGSTPDLMLACVISISMYEGERGGGIAGVAAGFLIDSLGGTGLSLLALPYMLCGYICGLCFSYILNRNFASWALYILISFAFREIFTFIYIFTAGPDCSFGYAVKSIVIPEYFSSVLTAPLLYFTVRPIARLFHRSRELT